MWTVWDVGRIAVLGAFLGFVLMVAREAAHIVWLALGDLTGPPAEPVIPCVPESASEPTEAFAGATEAEEQAWAEQWAARARG